MKILLIFLINNFSIIYSFPCWWDDDDNDDVAGGDDDDDDYGGGWTEGMLLANDYSENDNGEDFDDNGELGRGNVMSFELKTRWLYLSAVRMQEGDEEASLSDWLTVTTQIS